MTLLKEKEKNRKKIGGNALIDQTGLYEFVSCEVRETIVIKTIKAEITAVKLISFNFLILKVKQIIRLFLRPHSLTR